MHPLELPRGWPGKKWRVQCCPGKRKLWPLTCDLQCALASGLDSWQLVVEYTNVSSQPDVCNNPPQYKQYTPLYARTLGGPTVL